MKFNYGFTYKYIPKISICKEKHLNKEDYHMEKPTTIKIEEAKREIVNKINEFRLPFNIIESILKDLYMDVKMEVLRELIEDVQIYECSLKEKMNQYKGDE